MTEFKIKAGILLDMLKYTQAAGRNIKGENKPLLQDCLLVIKTTGISISSIEEKEALIVNAKHKLDKKNVKKSGNIPTELEPAIKSLKRYGYDDEIKVSLKGGMIKFSRVKPKLEVKIPTIDESNIKSAMESDFPFIFKDNIWQGRRSGLKLDTYIKLDAAQFKEVVEDGEQIKYRSFPFIVSKEQAVVTVEDSDTGAQIVRELKIEEIKTPDTIGSLYSYGFGNAFGNLTGMIEIWLTNESPMVIKKEINDLKLIYMLATTELEPEEVEEDVEENTDNVDSSIEEQAEEALNEEEGEEEYE